MENVNKILSFHKIEFEININEQAQKRMFFGMSQDVKKAAKIIIEEDVRELMISFDLDTVPEDVNKNLEAFGSCINLESIVISADNYNYSFVNKLKNLKRFETAFKLNGEIDFSNFPQLEICGLPWQKGIETLRHCDNLKVFGMGTFGYEDLTFFSNLHNLTTLRLGSRKLQSLKGIENFKLLQELELRLCTKLIDIKDLTNLKELKELKINTCNKLSNLQGMEGLENLKKMSFADFKNGIDISPLSELHNLEELYFLYEGKIKSLKPIQGLKKLRVVQLIGQTNVLDGDLTPLIGLEEVIVGRYRKHYFHNPVSSNL